MDYQVSISISSATISLVILQPLLSPVAPIIAPFASDIGYVLCCVHLDK